VCDLQWLESNNWKVGGSIPTLATQKDWWHWQLEGCQSTSLSRPSVPWARHCTPMLPGRCEWLLTAPVYGICIYGCVTLCMCVSTGNYLDGLKAKDKFCVYACIHDNKSDLNLNLNRFIMDACLYLHHQQLCSTAPASTFTVKHRDNKYSVVKSMVYMTQKAKT